MNSHSDIQKLLSAYCGNDLSTGDRIMVEEHLSECPICRAELADLQITTRLIRTTPEVESPPWMTVRIMARIREEKASRRSWLKNLFFPLHIKIPLEVMALLVVCVSGYYMSRTVETELKAPSVLQDAPPAAPVEDKPVKRAMPIQPTESKTEKAVPMAPVQKNLDSRNDAVQSSESTLSAPTVPQPILKSERAAPAAGAAAEPAMKSVPGAGVSSSSLDAAPEMKKKSSKGAQRQEMESMAPAPAGRAVRDTADKYVPQLLLRLTVSDSSVVAGDIRSAATRSGAQIVEESGSNTTRLILRIPVLRLPDLVEQLGRIGRLSDYPKSYGNAQEMEVTIIW
jgi:anti-sigma factor RsiW